MARFDVDIVLKARDEATSVVTNLVGLTKKLGDRRKLLTKYTRSATTATRALAKATVQSTKALEAVLPNISRTVAETNTLTQATRSLGIVRRGLTGDTRQLVNETKRLTEATRRTPAPRAPRAPRAPGAGGGRTRGGGSNDGYYGAVDFRAHRLADAFAGAGMTIKRVTADLRRGLTTPITLAANYEQAMTEVRAVTTDAQLSNNFDLLSDKARQLGRDTEFTAEQVAYGLKYMGVAGWGTQEQLAGISPMLDVATYSGLELAKTSDYLTDVMGGFGLKATDTVNGVSALRFVADSMVATTKNANTNIDQLSRGMFKVGPLARAAGVEFNEVSAMLGTLAEAGIKGAEGGTALRNILLSVTGKPSKDMRKLLKAMGLDAKKLRTTLDEKGLAGTMRELMVQTDKLSRPMKLFAANTLFGRRTAVSAVAIMHELENSYGDLRVAIDESAGASASTAEEYRSTAKAAGKQLTSALQDLGITVGEQLMPALLPLVEDAKAIAKEFGDWAKANPKLVQTLGKTAIRLVIFGTLLSPVLLSLSAITSVLTFGRTAWKLWGMWSARAAAKAAAAGAAGTAAGAGATAAGAGGMAGARGMTAFGRAAKLALGPVGLLLATAEAVYLVIDHFQGKIASLNDSAVDTAKDLVESTKHVVKDASDEDIAKLIASSESVVAGYEQRSAKTREERGWFGDMMNEGRDQNAELAEQERERLRIMRGELARRRNGTPADPGAEAEVAIAKSVTTAAVDRRIDGMDSGGEILVRVADDRVRAEVVRGETLSVRTGISPGGL